MDHEQWLEEHDRMLADHDRKMAELREADQRLQAYHERTERLLRRAIRAAVHEARDARERWRRTDDAIMKLAAAQLVTEEKLQRLERLHEQRYGGNGGH